MGTAPAPVLDYPSPWANPRAATPPDGMLAVVENLVVGIAA